MQKVSFADTEIFVRISLGILNNFIFLESKEIELSAIFAHLYSAYHNAHIAVRLTIFLHELFKCLNIGIFPGKTKCMMKTGDCIIKHAGNFTTGMQMIVSSFNKFDNHDVNKVGLKHARF